MYQQEIKFFWPLTEQIPLDLDYSECDKPKITVSSVEAGKYSLTSSSNWDSSNYTITAASLNLDVESTTVKLKEKPGFIRRSLYDCLGLKWELK